MINSLLTWPLKKLSEKRIINDSILHKKEFHEEVLRVTNNLVDFVHKNEISKIIVMEKTWLFFVPLLRRVLKLNWLNTRVLSMEPWDVLTHYWATGEINTKEAEKVIKKLDNDEWNIMLFDEHTLTWDRLIDVYKYLKLRLSNKIFVWAFAKSRPRRWFENQYINILENFWWKTDDYVYLKRDVSNEIFRWDSRRFNRIEVAWFETIYTKYVLRRISYYIRDQVLKNYSKIIKE